MSRQLLWDALAGHLRQSGVETIFGIPNDDMLAARSFEREHLRLILAHDQRNAMFTTAGYALAGRRLGICVVGKGPALTNTVTGLLESASVSAPVLLIAAGTEMRRVGTFAFQEAEQLAVVRPLVKWAYRVEHASRLLWAVDRAMFLAVNGNPGPVYLEVPEDLEWDAGVERKAFPPERLRSIPAPRDVDALVERMRAARRPLILFGGGTRGDANTESRERLAEATGAAIFVTASGRGAVGEDHAQFCGLAGLYTARPMRALWQRADLIVVVASRMEDTATMLLDGVERHGDIVQIDVDAGNFCHRYRVTRLLGDAMETVSQLTERLGGASMGMNEWGGEVEEAKRAALAERDRLLDRCAGHARIHIAEILAAMEIALPADMVLVQENGLVDMWSYCYPQFTLGRGQRSLSPGEQTTLGFGAAAALGVKLASPEGTMVVALVGDGAFDMYRADLFSSADHGAPVTYIVLNNRGFGWLEYQARCGGMGPGRFATHGSVVISHPDVVSFTIADRNEILDRLGEACRLNRAGKTVVIDVPISGATPDARIQDFYGEVSE